MPSLRWGLAAALPLAFHGTMESCQQRATRQKQVTVDGTNFLLAVVVLDCFNSLLGVN